MELLIPCFDIPSRVLRKKDLLSREYKDPTSVVIFVGTGLGVEYFVFECFLPFVPNPHL